MPRKQSHILRFPENNLFSLVAPFPISCWHLDKLILLNETSVQCITLFYFVFLRNLQFNNTKVTFARIEMCHCHVLKLSIYTLCLSFYYKICGILLMQRVKRTHSPVVFFIIIILFLCGRGHFGFKILITHQLISESDQLIKLIKFN